MLWPPKIIGLCGRKGCGKSTAGRILIELLGMHEVSFADPLKRGIQSLFGLSHAQLWGDRKDEVDPDWGVAPRELLQYVGTDVFRELLPRAMGWESGDPRRSPWVFQMERELTQQWAADPSRTFVVTDVRFPDEAELIRRLGGVVWQVDRTLPEDTPFLEHRSEGRNDLFPSAHIDNDGTVAELRWKIDAMVRIPPAQIS